MTPPPTSLSEQGLDIGSGQRAFEQELGLTLPDDLETLLGESLTLVIGSKNLEMIPTLTGPADLTNLDVGLSLVSEPAKAKDLADRLVTLVGQLDVQLTATQTDDGAAIATNGHAAEALSGGGDLGDDATFKAAVPDADRAFGSIYVDISSILDTLVKADPPAEVAAQIKQLAVLSAVGGSVSRKSDHVAQSTLRVTFTD